MASVLGSPQGLSTLVRALRAPAPGRLAFARDPDTGQLTSDPTEIDRLARAEWGHIYQGNIPLDAQWQHADAFMSKYSHYIPALDQFELPPITPARLMAEFKAASQSAPGPDGWALGDLQHITLRAATYLSSMLMLIESGTPWPQQLTLAKAIFLAKVESPLTPLDYRLLTITSHIYRRWASLRLKDVESWAARWVDPSMYAGVPERAASEASWLLSHHLELAKLQGRQMVGLSVDLFKCFDQLSRPLLYRIAQRLGAPCGLLAGWFSMLSQLSVINVLSNGVGTEYSRGLSIPQGCPYPCCGSAHSRYHVLGHSVS